MPPYLESPAAYAEFLAQFHAGSIPRAQWNHAAHLAMAAGVVHGCNPETAVNRVRAGILAYAVAQGIVHSADSGYHETVTRFWVARVLELNAGLGRGSTPFDAARAAVAAFAHRGGLVSEYYTYDLIPSREARRDYLPPDR